MSNFYKEEVLNRLQKLLNKKDSIKIDRTLNQLKINNKDTIGIPRSGSIISRTSVSRNK